MLRIAALLVVLSGCAASVAGTIDGKPLASPDAVARKTEVFGLSGATVTIGGGGGDLCDELTKGVTGGEATFLELGFGRLGDLDPGSYPIGLKDGKGASATARFLDSACGVALRRSATDGSIVLEQSDADGMVGTFDVTFENGDRLEGSFNARLCAADFPGELTCD